LEVQKPRGIHPGLFALVGFLHSSVHMREVWGAHAVQAIMASKTLGHDPDSA